MDKIIDSIYKIITSTITIFMAVALFFSLQSNTLSIDNLSFKFITIIVFLVLFLSVSLFFFNKNFIISILAKLKKNQIKIYWSLFIVCILYQLILLKILDATPSFDAGLLLNSLKDKSEISQYLSINPNNQFIYFFELFLSKIIGTSIKSFQFINIITITLSIYLINILGRKLFNSKSAGYLSSILLMYFVTFQPLFLVPYTDTFSLVPMLGSILFILYTIRSKNKQSLIFIFLSGILTSIAYLIRPSSIIFIIAIFIVVSLNSLSNIKILKKFMVFLPIFLIGLVICLVSFNIFVSKQKYIDIDSSKEIPMTHFLLLGSHGDENKKNSLHGTWNSEDIQTTYSQPTKDLKSKADWAAFVKRTKDRGFSRSIKFYLIKYSQIMDSGVIGYHRDGLWFNGIFSDSKHPFKNKIQQIFYENGSLRPTFNFICQMIWLLILLFIINGGKKNINWKYSTISLTLFGGIMFLIIFESGGTKYMLQYVPFICLLAANNINLWVRNNS